MGFFVLFFWQLIYFTLQKLGQAQMNTALYSELLSKCPALAGKKKNKPTQTGLLNQKPGEAGENRLGICWCCLMGGDSCTPTPHPCSPLTPVRLVFMSCKSLPCSQYNPRKIPHTQLTLALFLGGCSEHAHVWWGWWGWQQSLVMKTQDQSMKGIPYTGLGS